MKIDLDSINREDFIIKEGVVAGEVCYLVVPKNNPDWTLETAIFRSSIWNAQGEPVSLGFKKFVNWGEKPSVFPDPTSLKNTNIPEKLDGSLLILSTYKGAPIARTRGTFDARKLDNGHEIDALLDKYPHVRDFNREDISLLFEWTTPSNRIIIDYGEEPMLKLIGAVYHKDYLYASQKTLDEVAETLGVERPKYYGFDSIDEMREAVDAFKGTEGVCVYFDNDQSIKKVKGLDYLVKHKFKSEMSTKNLVEYYFENGITLYSEFIESLEKAFDFEIKEMCVNEVSTICTGMEEVWEIEHGMLGFITKLKDIPRKEQAERIMNAYGCTGRSGMVFTLLDGKKLSVAQLKKLLFQVLYA